MHVVSGIDASALTLPLGGLAVEDSVQTREISTNRLAWIVQTEALGTRCAVDPFRIIAESVAHQITPSRVVIQLGHAGRVEAARARAPS